VTLFCVACSSTPIIPGVDYISEPGIGEISTKNAGEVLLAQGTREFFNSVEIVSDQYDGRVPKGTYLAVKRAYGYTIYEPRPKDVSLVREFGKYFLARKNNQLFYCNYGAGGSVVPHHELPSTSYHLSSTTAESDNNFQQVLIYMGAEDNILYLTYREFFGNMEGFSKDFSHNLENSDEIVYEKARLKIINLTDQSITYGVVHHFN
jgi:hypothetical protein